MTKIEKHKTNVTISKHNLLKGVLLFCREESRQVTEEVKTELAKKKHR